MPGTVQFGIDLALAVTGAAAGAVLQTFGTTSNGTDAAGSVDGASSAGGAAFEPESGLFAMAQKNGVDAGHDELGLEAVRDAGYAYAAGQGNDRSNIKRNFDLIRFATKTPGHQDYGGVFGFSTQD